MTVPSNRPSARPAGPELLVLARCEEFAGWLLDRTAKWPKSARFTLTQRLENHALDIVEELVSARYHPRDRRGRLEAVNLRLERMRHLLRLALGARICPVTTAEAAIRALDEVGRMLHGWRSSLSRSQPAPPS